MRASERVEGRAHCLLRVKEERERKGEERRGDANNPRISTGPTTSLDFSTFLG
jgi:hypothetical protein